MSDDYPAEDVQAGGEESTVSATGAVEDGQKTAPGMPGVGAGGRGVSPYSTGGGGVAFAYRVATVYLASMLTDGRVAELGDEVVTRVSFQTGPGHAVDDLLVEGDRHSVAIACRATPNFVPSDAPTVQLVRSLVRELKQHGSESHRVVVAAAGREKQWDEVAELTAIASSQADADAFVAFLEVLGRSRVNVRRRYLRLREVIEKGLEAPDIQSSSEVTKPGHPTKNGVGDGAGTVHTEPGGDHSADVHPTADRLDRTAFGLLSRLRLVSFELQAPTERDWATAATTLDAFTAPDADGIALRDRIAVLSSEYDPAGAVVDRAKLRRDTHRLLDLPASRTRTAWHELDRHRGYALAAVRRSMGSDAGTDSGLSFAFKDRGTELAGQITEVCATAGTLLVSGQSGVGKSAIVLSTTETLQNEAKVDSVVLNLRELPDTTMELERHLGISLRDVMDELAGPVRTLVVDAADVVLERSSGLLGDLLGAATEADVGVVLVCSDAARDLLEQLVSTRRSHEPAKYTMSALDDDEIRTVAARYPGLSALLNGLAPTSLLRRLVVLDLLARTGRTLSGNLNEWDCLQLVWDGLVRKAGDRSSASPEARAQTLLAVAAATLADTAPREGPGQAGPVPLDHTAVDSLQRDHLLAPPSIYRPRPDFAHDELRRYATAVLLTATASIGARLEQSGVPRWSLAAATLACKGQLLDPSKRPADTFLSLLTDFRRLATTHGLRWADAPVEAVLETPFAYECLRAALGDQSSATVPDGSTVDAEHSAGAEATLPLADVLRIVKQRLYPEGRLDLDSSEPVVEYLTGLATPWRGSDNGADLITDWLRGHALANTPPGHPVRLRLRDQLLAHWAAYPAATPEPTQTASTSASGRPHRRQRLLDHHVTGNGFVTTLALLARDMNTNVDAALRTIADLAPEWLAPAADSPYAARGIATYDPQLLAHLVLRYYINDTPHAVWGSHDQSVRDHRGLGRGVGYQLHAYWNGGFWALFNTAPLEVSAHVLNELTNHAARTRVARMARHDRDLPTVDSSDTGDRTMNLTGHPVAFAGDSQVWSWYRCTSVGPYPCLSALAAMERVAQTMLEQGMTAQTLCQTLLTGCENLAVPGLVFGLLVRNLEAVGDAIDPFLAEPEVWSLEARRVTSEYSALKASSEGLPHPERRTWRLQWVAAHAVLNGDPTRKTELRATGDLLKENARRLGIADLADDWAANLDFDRYVFTPHSDGYRVTIDDPPDSTDPTATPDNEAAALERTNTILELELRYRRPVQTDPDRETPTPANIATDLERAATLLDAAEETDIIQPFEAIMLVVRTAVLRAGDGEPEAFGDHAFFAVESAIGIAESFAGRPSRSHEDAMWDSGPDRSAAAVLPVLLTPPLAPALAETGVTPVDVAAAGSTLAGKAALEARLFLAQGCDRIWDTPCAGTPCVHAVALDWLLETARDAELGPWDNDRQTLTDVRIEGDVPTRLEELDGTSVYISALDPIIRGLGGAASHEHCQTVPASELLTRVLAVQAAAMVRHEEGNWNADWQGRHSAISARALLQTSVAGTDTDAILKFLDTMSADAGLLMNTLHGLAGAGSETAVLAETARAVWPTVFDRVLIFAVTKPDVLTDRSWGDWILAALLPSPLTWGQRLSNEPEGDPIDWVDATALTGLIDAWLLHARGISKCADALTDFLARLPLAFQATRGLDWTTALRLDGHTVTVTDARRCDDWLIAIRPAAEANGTLPQWQTLVDSLVAAGNQPLAPYST